MLQQLLDIFPIEIPTLNNSEVIEYVSSISFQWCTLWKVGGPRLTDS